MKIAVVDVAAETSGALSVLNDFHSYIFNSPKACEHEWFFFTSKPILSESDYIHNIRNVKIKRSWLRRFFWDNFSFRKIDKSFKFDVVVSLQNACVRCICPRQLVYFHNVLLLENKNQYSLKSKRGRLMKLLNKYTFSTFKRAECVITQTDTVRKKIIQRCGVNNVKVVNPNVFLDDYSESRTLEKSNIGFIYPANPIAFKNHKIILEAFKKIIKKGCNSELLLTFDPEKNGLAKELYLQSKEINSIRFLGYMPRQDIMDLYSNHTLVWASSLESYPIPFQEARYMGTVIVAPNEDYAIEILRDYSNCLFYEKNNVEDLCEKMILAMGMKHIQSDISHNGNTWREIETIILGEDNK